MWSPSSLEGGEGGVAVGGADLRLHDVDHEAEEDDDGHHRLP